ncbi:MAG: hypothetical protein H6Q72_1219 [Firmicutes bacterium]|nr:hypothetical protein [Bacillota bacterium]
MTQKHFNKIQFTVQNHEEKTWKKFLRRAAVIALIGIVDTEWTRWHISASPKIASSLPDNSIKTTSAE